LRVVECRDHVRNASRPKAGESLRRFEVPRVGFSSAKSSVGARHLAMLTDTIARQISRRGYLASPRVEALTQMH
jgi:hypothetical protein